MSLEIEALINVKQKDGTRTVTGYSNEEIEAGSVIKLKHLPTECEVSEVGGKKASRFKPYKYHYELVCKG